MDSDTQNTLQVIHRDMMVTGLEVLIGVIPRKAIELHRKIQDLSTPGSQEHPIQMRSEFTSQIHTSNFEPSPKKRKREDGQNFGNEHSDDPNSSRYDDPSAAFSSRQISTRSRSYIKVDSYIIIKQECEKMLQFTDQAKLWVTLSLSNAGKPQDKRLKTRKDRWSDCTITSVDDASDLLSELDRAQEAALNIRDTCRNECLTRAKLCSKIFKYPDVEDYLVALEEHDEYRLFLSHQHLRDLRNIYVALADTVKTAIT